MMQTHGCSHLCNLIYNLEAIPFRHVGSPRHVMHIACLAFQCDCLGHVLQHLVNRCVNVNIRYVIADGACRQRVLPKAMAINFCNLAGSASDLEQFCIVRFVFQVSTSKSS